MLTFSVARSPTLRSEQRSNSPRSFLCALLSRFSCWQHPTPTAMSVNHLQSASPIATNRTSSCLTSGHTVQYNVDALVVSTFFFVLFPPTCLHDSADYKNHFPDHPPLMVKGLYYNKRCVHCYSTLLKPLNDFAENCSVKVPNIAQ